MLQRKDKDFNNFVNERNKLTHGEVFTIAAVFGSSFLLGALAVREDTAVTILLLCVLVLSILNAKSWIECKCGQSYCMGAMDLIDDIEEDYDDEELT